jgi:putative endonuclease
MSGKYFVYILQCRDGSLYSGWTIDLEKRLKAHNEGTTGAKYTRARRPVTLVFFEEYDSKVAAQKREYQIKHLRRAAKLALIAGTSPERRDSR